MRRLAAIVTLTLLAGCDFGSVSPEDVDWGFVRQADASCFGPVDATPDFHDLNGDGKNEIFLIMGCRDAAEERGDQLEIITGGSEPESARPTKLVLQVPTPARVEGLCFIGRSAYYQVIRRRQSTFHEVRWDGEKGKPVVRNLPAPGCAAAA
ncbi:hypothetical protein ACQPZJ_08430 [Actinoplanes sp. CA-054009]